MITSLNIMTEAVRRATEITGIKFDKNTVGSASQDLKVHRGNALVQCKELSFGPHYFVHVVNVINERLTEWAASVRDPDIGQLGGAHAGINVKLIGLDELRRSMLHHDEHLAYFDPLLVDEQRIENVYSLTVVVLGTGKGQPEQDARALEECLRHARRSGCDVWIVQDPRHPFNQKHPAWSTFVGDWIEHHNLTPFIIESFTKPTLAKLKERLASIAEKSPDEDFQDLPTNPSTNNP